MAFGLDTILLTEDCKLCNITELKDGDRIFGPTGKVLTVSHINKEGASPLYRVNSEASWYRVTEGHVLNLMCGKAGLRNPVSGADMYLGQTFNVSVEDYLKQDPEFQQNVYGYYSTLSFPYVDPEFPPYEFGVILSHENYMDGVKMRMNRTNINIPQSYLRNSAEMRKLLFAGYADGKWKECYKGGRLKLRIEDEMLRSDIMWLIKSLGFTAYCTDDNVLEVLGKLGNVPADILKMTNDDSQLYYTIEIKPDGTGKTIDFDIQEDGEKLVMLGDFSVIHI